ncbi:GntR family transcriptional regulator [Mesorhizobium opportunistum]|uniref:GntR family transcriptional regulator n=1 Tax=Mesorhizobium opportunistum TaxID=593909 RepID=A0ABV1YHM4_9HYPH|nr:GntR family transcriptional regulator [Mesorhizobium sp.]TIN96475.1 MAG: GntR family transcriptional regulator [Mesorhizobium sp.]TJU98149.1 MAG: GntR family transcriptional regulator [Mesorhizobium sp.]TJV15943.1 MAG: GntR family transcriptional regulator [Mesorhizobium sp.]
MKSTKAKPSKSIAPPSGTTAPSTADLLRSEQAYEQLKSDIVACVLSPGEALTEKQIEARYGIKKATIRSALARLMQEGLVRSEPRRGYVITTLTLRDVNEIFDVRGLVEPEVFRVATTGITGRGLDEIRLAARKVLKPETLRSPVAFLAADRAFRLAIAELSGNLRLALLLSQILDQSERALHLGFKSRDFMPLIIEQQKQLLQACEKSDVPGIVKLARSHCLALKHQLIGALLGGPKLREANLQDFV